MMTVSGRLAALHIASLWCIAVAQPLFDVLRGSPEFFVAHDTWPANLVGFVLLCCLAGPTTAALALWIAGRLAPRWQPGTAGIMVGSLTAAVALAALKPLGGCHPGLSLALAAGLRRGHGLRVHPPRTAPPVCHLALAGSRGGADRPLCYSNNNRGGSRPREQTPAYGGTARLAVGAIAPARPAGVVLRLVCAQDLEDTTARERARRTRRSRLDARPRWSSI